MYEVGSVLSVRKDFYRHVGIYAGDGMVFHNHPDSGQQLVTLAEFAGGRKVALRNAGKLDKLAFQRRLRDAKQQPDSYNLLLRNCEHTVSSLRNGSAISPQLWLYSGIAALTLAGSLLIKRTERR